jgi:hypothetical protein
VADRLTSGQRLTANQSLTSNDGRFTLVMQGDGNLVLYGPGGRARWASNTWGRPVDRATMQSDGNLVVSGPSLGTVWQSRTTGNSGASLVVQDDGNLVIYRTDGTPVWASNTAILRSFVPGFLPNRNGLHFPNSFPHIPHLTIPTGSVNVPIGDAANGLCGGMVYTVRDYFQAGVPPPQMHSPPTSGPLYDHIVRRLYMSFEIPFGPYKYLHLMNPTLPDHETDLSRLGLAPHGRAWEMIVAGWPRIRADLDAGRLAPMALVQVKSHDALKMGDNHQVLAYGYELDLTDLQIFVYDPNYPDDDWCVLRLDIGDPQHTTAVSYTHEPGGMGTIWCFFHVGYTYWPPPTVSAPGGSQWRTWESLGGVLSSGPDVCSWASGRLDVFARGMDNALWHKWFDGGWSGWESLGGELTSDPAAVSWDHGRIDVFARGTDGSLVHKWYDGGWSGWESLGGELVGGPDVSSWAAGRLDVFARGADNALWWKSYEGRWFDWKRLDGTLGSDPAAVSWGPGRIDVFARGEDSNPVVFHKWYEGNWSDWEVLESNLLSGPDAASWGPGRLDVFVHGYNEQLWHRWYDGNWSAWETLGGRLSSGPTAVSWGPDRVDVFARFPDNALWHRWYG